MRVFIQFGKCTEKGGEIRAKTKNSLVFFYFFFEHFLNGIFFYIEYFYALRVSFFTFRVFEKNAALNFQKRVHQGKKRRKKVFFLV